MNKISEDLYFAVIGVKEEPKKVILYDQALIATFAWAASNFFFGILEAHDFPTSCL